MFSNDGQIARACIVLLRGVRLERHWTPTGPTSEAVKLIQDNGGPLSSGERAMLLVASALWSGSPSPLTFAELLEKLDNKNLRLIGELLLAMADERGSVAIDEWLSRKEPATA